MYDKKGRFIDVGTQGLLARDASGNVIHDIVPDSLTKDFSYAGHFYPFTDTNYVVNTSGVDTDEDVHNIDLSTYFSGVKDLLDYKFMVCLVQCQPANALVAYRGVRIYDLIEYNDTSSQRYEGYVAVSNGAIRVGQRVYFKIHNVSGTPYLSFLLDYGANTSVYITALGITK
jgi:hypothetical protein